jgi:hypothetical protein
MWVSICVRPTSVTQKISIFAGSGRINADMAFKHHMHSVWRASDQRNQRVITRSKSTTKATRGG